MFSQVSTSTFPSSSRARGGRPPVVRNAARGLKIGATSRTQAVLYGVRHGFTPDTHRIDHWLGGP